ncbi:hypothetical protein NDU88_006141 [Pleurodeles waltl]|uniref:Tick transposon n=1 Tax=Pleurodeles waltl TaxID=8319 RepID=A0AAV7NPX3_PLEWA|nr:hypothetical protein NDU88_006141 [Pleurodeles waltl]
MLGGRSSNKHTGKPAEQLLFSEALRQSRTSSPAPKVHPPCQFCNMTDPTQGATVDRIRQEISAVGRRLEGMDGRMASLTEETKSLRLDIAGFQLRVTNLEQRVMTMEAQAVLTPDRDQELLYLCNKIIDLEDRSRWDNVRFLGFPENKGGADVQSFLKVTLPKLTGLTFNPPPLSFKERIDSVPNAETGMTTLTDYSLFLATRRLGNSCRQPSHMAHSG